MKQVMYIGPDIKGIVKKNEIFTYFPMAVVEQVERIYSPARELFVSMDDIVSKRNERDRAGSALNLIYKIVKNSTTTRR